MQNKLKIENKVQIETFPWNIKIRICYIAARLLVAARFLAVARLSVVSRLLEKQEEFSKESIDKMFYFKKDFQTL